MEHPVDKEKKNLPTIGISCRSIIFELAYFEDGFRPYGVFFLFPSSLPLLLYLAFRNGNVITCRSSGLTVAPSTIEIAARVA